MTIFNHVFNMDGIEGLRTMTVDENRSRIVVVTDPPFNIGYGYNKYDDRMSDDDYIMMLSRLLSYHCVIVNYPETLYRLSAYNGMYPDRVVSWVYNTNNRRQHRDIAFYNLKVDFKRVRQPYKNPNDRRVKALIEKGSKGAAIYDWWEVQQVKNVSDEKLDHPCQMPLEVMRRVIGVLDISKDSIIVDPFAGTGTTLLAAKNAGYEYVGFEIDEKYSKIAEERLSCH